LLARRLQGHIRYPCSLIPQAQQLLQLPARLGDRPWETMVAIASAADLKQDLPPLLVPQSQFHLTQLS
jgi:hypothetical protein